MGLRYGTAVTNCYTNPTVSYSQDSSLCVQSFAVKIGEIQHIIMSYTDGIACSPCGVTQNTNDIDIRQVGDLVVDPKVKFSTGVLSASIVQQGVVPSNHLDGTVKISINATDFNLRPDEKYEITLAVDLNDGRRLSQSFIIKVVHPSADIFGISGSLPDPEDPVEVTGTNGIVSTPSGNDFNIEIDIGGLPEAPG